MKNINKNIKIGTFVKILGDEEKGWQKVTEVKCPHIKVENNRGGSLQMCHIKSYTNKKISTIVQSNG
jgi:hypothetical protein